MFDLRSEDVFWCTADIGWITGHSYVVYGPLLNGCKILIYEGAPSEPDWGRTWSMIERYRVTKFYTAPTAIRAFMSQEEDWPSKYDLSSLKLLGSVGEPINPKAWHWYDQNVGKKRCPIVDTWWQTETGSIMISALPGCVPTKAGSAATPLFGVKPEILDSQGESVPANEGGSLVIKNPWPSMARTIFGRSPALRRAVLESLSGYYCTGDGARQDEDGYFWVMGRIDDVLNVSGHRLSTMEIESALVSHNSVSEAAVVARPDDLTGQAIVCFVMTGNVEEPSSDLTSTLTQHVVEQIGKLARPAEIRVVQSLPKTRSVKLCGESFGIWPVEEK